MGFFSDHVRLRVLIPAIIIWGCFGGICFSLVSFWAYKIEKFLDISCYSGLVFPLLPVWKFGTFAILLLTLGMIAADLFRSGRKTGRDPALTGVLSGICTALVGILLYGLYSLPGFYWDKGLFNVIRIFIGWDILALSILASAVLQGLGAWIQGSRQSSGSNNKDTTSPAIINTKCHPWFSLIVLLGVLLVLPLPLYALPVDDTKYCATGDTCEPGAQCSRVPVPDEVNISRISPDSIRIGLKTIYPCGTSNTFKIYLNGKDISNQDRIAKSGLDVTISPHDGLGKYDGNSVILQGGDIAVNETVPLHIQVNGTPPSGMHFPPVFSDQYL